jgi:hypothetical protein
MRSDFSECGDSSPLSPIATGGGEARRADKSTREKAATSRRNPKFGSVRPQTLFARMNHKSQVANWGWKVANHTSKIGNRKSKMAR